MRQFKYNVIELIDGIRRRPCIWDRDCESYKDRVERKCAWEEIFSELEKDFESMNAEQRRFVEEQIVTKWANIRDTFHKTLKTKMGKPKKRKYVLHNELKFLIKDTPQDGSEEEDANEDFYTNEEYINIVIPKEEEPPVEPEVSPESRKKSRKKKDFLNNCNNLTTEFVTYDDANEARVMNEDEAFFASLLPTVATYTLEERLDFRMEVLTTMKRINSRRN